MAVLNKIRQRSFFLIVIIALALFSFVLADLFKNSDALTGGSQDVIASVNGNDIDRVDFMNRVETVQRSLGPNATSTQAMNRVYDEKIRESILSEHSDNLGITIEQAYINDMLRQSMATYPEFQNEAGMFDPAKLQEFIANLEAIKPQPAQLGNFMMTWNDWLNFEQNLMKSAKEQVYLNLVKAGANATLSEAQLDYMMENETIDVKYVQIPYTTISDSLVEVSKDEMNDYIEKHKADYESEASRNLNFVEFVEEPTMEDEEEVKANLQSMLNNRVEYNPATKRNDSIKGFKDTQNNAEFVSMNSSTRYSDTFIFKTALPSQYQDTIYNLNVGEVFGPYKNGGFYNLTKLVDTKMIPDSAKVRHILIPFVGATRVDPTVTATDVEAKSQADSILGVLKTNRKKFVELLDLSSDKVSNEKEGVIEFSYNDSYAPEFKAFSFENNIGDIDVVKTSFGYHIIEILSQTGKAKAVKIATVSQEVEPSERTVDEVYNRASKFESAVQDEVFQDVAAKNNYEVRTINNVKELQESLPGLGNNRAIVRWAFEDGTNVGDFKRFSIPTGGYAIVQVVKISKEGLMSPEDLPTNIVQEIRNKKKAEIIRKKITGNTVDEIAASQNVTVQTSTAVNMKTPTLLGAGEEPMVVGYAFGLKQGQTSKLINGNKGVYMIEVTQRTEAPKLDNYQAVMKRLSNTKTGVSQNKAYDALKAAADIEDNRARFY
ncbi:peptidyl-prolyl cis-trans isomerase D [Flavobacteriaceae bacterium MAR_2010_188]|nr:peptidyl-prolyl cis-trans isomerase D [Flavobacteriaceae bacterium MAR_2010_188]